MPYRVRQYTADDEPSWLRCRVLSFLATAYYDDVDRVKPSVTGCELVAVDDTDTLVGVLDTSVSGALATIDTVAVHPDHQRAGIGRRLLDETRRRARELGATTLDAWTRDDEGTLRWYRAMGFAESDHYLHVHAHAYTDVDEPARAVDRPRPDLRPVGLFLHADLTDEERLRREFQRVHVCRRFSMPL